MEVSDSRDDLTVRSWIERGCDLMFRSDSTEGNSIRLETFAAHLRVDLRKIEINPANPRNIIILIYLWDSRLPFSIEPAENLLFITTSGEKWSSVRLAIRQRLTMPFFDSAGTIWMSYHDAKGEITIRQSSDGGLTFSDL